MKLTLLTTTLHEHFTPTRCLDHSCTRLFLAEQKRNETSGTTLAKIFWIGARLLFWKRYGGRIINHWFQNLFTLTTDTKLWVKKLDKKEITLFLDLDEVGQDTLDNTQVKNLNPDNGIKQESAIKNWAVERMKQHPNQTKLVLRNNKIDNQEKFPAI